MRKFAYILPILIFFVTISQATFAEEPEGGDVPIESYIKDVETGFSGQKMITDEEFEKVYQQEKAKRENKKVKNKKKINQQPPQNMSPLEKSRNELSNAAIKDFKLLGLPVTLETSEGEEIPVGHYKIEGVKINNKIYLDFYQSYSRVARVQAIETNDDFNQQYINFVQLIPCNENKIKIIYGSMDFNAYAYIKIKDGIEGN